MKDDVTAFGIELPPPPGGLRLVPPAERDETALAAADRAARQWRSPEPGPLKPGSVEHKRAVARMFGDTFNPYRPAVIDWPKLDDAARERLVHLPIWDIAVRTEGKARLRMLSYARTIADPDWRAAVELNGWEEGRHKAVLANLVAAYGICLAPEPSYPPPADREWGFMITGFSECIDSFFAFGLFALAERSGFFPPELVETFEPVMQEECRHILLFANWLAAHRRSLSWWRRLGFELRVVAVWVFLVWERAGIARGMNGRAKKAADNNFTLTGSKAVSNAEIRPADFLALCLAENDRRFAGYDARLLRPTTMPRLARLALRLLRR
jgi:hypothetical protein